MSVKLQTLEHLDGKQVRFSTITSQYPELFVKRKRNVGELIISTDLDTRYGMHHIYAGGEHIASGYGFATVKTRNDLTYIQETYNGIFKYFNDAYTYHSNAYNWLTGYVINSYKFILNEIAYNSYKNVMVDEKNNSFIINDTTYTLYAGNGTISFKKDIDKFIRLTSPNNYYLQKTFLDFTKDNNISDVKYNKTENSFVKYIAFAKLKIYIDRTAIGGDPDKLYYKFVYNTGIDETSSSLTDEQKNIIDILNAGIYDAHGNKWTLHTIDDILHNLIKGKWPEEYNEVMLMLPDENSISDMLLYAIGLRDLDELYISIGSGKFTVSAVMKIICPKELDIYILFWTIEIRCDKILKVFSSKENVIFLEPVMTEELLNVHKKFIKFWPKIEIL